MPHSTWAAVADGFPEIMVSPQAAARAAFSWVMVMILGVGLPRAWCFTGTSWKKASSVPEVNHSRSMPFSFIDAISASAACSAGIEYIASTCIRYGRLRSSGLGGALRAPLGPVVAALVPRCALLPAPTPRMMGLRPMRASQIPSRWAMPESRTVGVAPPIRISQRRKCLWLSTTAREHLYPTVHQGLAAVDVGLVEPAAQLNPVDRVQRSGKIRLVAVWQGGIDAHTTFEAGVGGCPLFVAGSHPLLRLKRLADATRNRIQDVGVRVDPRGQRPDDLVHAVHVDVGIDGDRQPHPLAGGQDRAEEVALPTLLDLVALFDLDDAAAPVGHRVRDIHVLTNTWLQAIAQLINGGFADRGIDIVVVCHGRAHGR